MKSARSFNRSRALRPDTTTIAADMTGMPQREL
jgi:hypothetical protein